MIYLRKLSYKRARPYAHVTCVCEFYLRFEGYRDQCNNVQVGSPLIASLIEWHLRSDSVEQLENGLFRHLAVGLYLSLTRRTNLTMKGLSIRIGNIERIMPIGISIIIYDTSTWFFSFQNGSWFSQYKCSLNDVLLNIAFELYFCQ